MSQFGSSGKGAKTLCLPVGLCLFRFLDLSANTEKNVCFFFGAHPHFIGCSFLAQLHVGPPRHCVSRTVHQRGLLRKVEAILEIYVTGLLGNAIGLPMLGRLGFAVDRPTTATNIGVFEVLFETATLGTWFSDLHLTFFPSFINDGDFSFSKHKSRPMSSHNFPRDSTAGEPSNSITETQNYKPQCTVLLLPSTLPFRQRS